MQHRGATKGKPVRVGAAPNGQGKGAEGQFCLALSPSPEAWLILSTAVILLLLRGRGVRKLHALSQCAAPNACCPMQAARPLQALGTGSQGGPSQPIELPPLEQLACPLWFYDSKLCTNVWGNRRVHWACRLLHALAEQGTVLGAFARGRWVGPSPVMLTLADQRSSTYPARRALTRSGANGQPSELFCRASKHRLHWPGKSM